MSFQEFFVKKDENRKKLGEIVKRTEKFTISIKIVTGDGGMYVFSQANENFSSTLERLEDMAGARKKEFTFITLRNTGMRLTVYE